MKKSVKFIILVLLTFILTGCDWDEVYEANKELLDRGVTCEYEFLKAEFIDCGKNSDCSEAAEKSIVLKANAEGFFVNDQDAWNTNIIYLGGYQVMLDQFDHEAVLNYYKDSGQCPKTISYGGFGDGSNLNTYLYYINNSGGWRFIYQLKTPDTGNINDDDSNNGDGGSDNTTTTPQDEFDASCQSPRAISCKQYPLEIGLPDNSIFTFFVELGRQKTTSGEIKEYFAISDKSNFEGASVVYKNNTSYPLETKVGPYTNGYQSYQYLFEVDSEQFKQLFIGENDYVEKLYGYRNNADMDQIVTIFLLATPYEGEDNIFEGGVDDGTSDNIELPPIALGKLTCEDLFKDGDTYNNTWQLLSTTLRFMQYLGIILATVLSIVDFVKVVPTQDKDAINKASKKAVTRLVIAIIIFFVPIILDFILDLVGFSNPTCGLL